MWISRRKMCGLSREDNIINQEFQLKNGEDKIMTFKEMIFKGLCDGTVKIIINPNDDCIACQIGEFWFYFIGSEDEDLTPDEVYESYTTDCRQSPAFAGFCYC